MIAVYGVWLVAGVIAVECICVPVPGETLLFAASIYAGTTHGLNIWSVMGAAVIGGICGNVVAYGIGRKFGYTLLMRYGPYLGLKESRILIGEYLFYRYGGKVIFFARFLPVLRSVAGVLAGTNKMPWNCFLTATVFGAIVWVSIDCSAAYFLGRELSQLAAPLGIALGIAAGTVVAAIAVIVAKQEKRLELDAKRTLRVT